MNIRPGDRLAIRLSQDDIHAIEDIASSMRVRHVHAVRPTDILRAAVHELRAAQQRDRGAAE